MLVEGAWTVESGLSRLKEVAGADIPDWVQLVSVWPTEEAATRDTLTLQGKRLLHEGAPIAASILGRADAWVSATSELRVLPVAVFDRVGGDPNYVWAADRTAQTSTD